MAQFKDREEYERWKAEKSRQAAQKAEAPSSEKDKQPSLPASPQPKQQSRPVSEGLPEMGELFSRTWDIYKERFGTLIALCLLMGLLFILPLAVFGGSGFALSLILPDLKFLLIGISIAIGTTISFVTLFWGMSGLLCAVTDETLTVREALRIGWPRVGGLMWLLTVLGFLTTGGFLLFFIPGVIFTVWFIFGQFIFIEGEERGMRALLMSKELVKGYWFEVFLRLFVIWFMTSILGIIPFLGPFLSFFSVPFVMIYSYLIYQDLKKLKGDVSITASAPEKLKWIGTATLGYVVVPLLIIAVFWASLVSSFLLLKGIMSSGDIQVFSPASPSDTGQSRSSSAVRPSNFNELLGTWSGKESSRGSLWTFTFSDGYNVYASGPEGWYRGKAAIHWEIADKGGLRVPPGAGVLDVDVEESSSPHYTGKTSVGAFSVSGGTTLKLCGGEPGQTIRPETFDPAPGIRCFELTKTASAPPPAPSSGSNSLQQSVGTEDDETRAAREVYKRCTEAIRSGNISEAKTYISRSTLADMERSGQIDMAMGMISGMNIDEFQATRQGDRITFSQAQKQGEATMSMSFTMVKEDNQWKLGN